VFKLLVFSILAQTAYAQFVPDLGKVNSLFNFNNYNYQTYDRGKVSQTGAYLFSYNLPLMLKGTNLDRKLNLKYSSDNRHNLGYGMGFTLDLPELAIADDKITLFGSETSEFVKSSCDVSLNRGTVIECYKEFYLNSFSTLVKINEDGKEKYLLHYPTGNLLEFNSKGLLTFESGSASSAYIKYQYNNDNQLIKIILPFNSEVKFEYFQCADFDNEYSLKDYTYFNYHQRVHRSDRCLERVVYPDSEIEFSYQENYLKKINDEFSFDYSFVGHQGEAFRAQEKTASELGIKVIDESHTDEPNLKIYNQRKDELTYYNQARYVRENFKFNLPHVRDGVNNNRGYVYFVDLDRDGINDEHIKVYQTLRKLSYGGSSIQYVHDQNVDIAGFYIELFEKFNNHLPYQKNSLRLGDFNGDGFIDFYVFGKDNFIVINKYGKEHERIALNTIFPKMSELSKSSVIADMNGDGYYDIITKENVYLNLNQKFVQVDFENSVLDEIREKMKTFEETDQKIKATIKHNAIVTKPLTTYFISGLHPVPGSSSDLVNAYQRAVEDYNKAKPISQLIEQRYLRLYNELANPISLHPYARGAGSNISDIFYALNLDPEEYLDVNGDGVLEKWIGKKKLEEIHFSNPHKVMSNVVNLFKGTNKLKYILDHGKLLVSEKIENIGNQKEYSTKYAYLKPMFDIRTQARLGMSDFIINANGKRYTQSYKRVDLTTNSCQISIPPKVSTIRESICNDNKCLSEKFLTYKSFFNERQCGSRFIGIQEEIIQKSRSYYDEVTSYAYPNVISLGVLEKKVLKSLKSGSDLRREEIELLKYKKSNNLVLLDRKTLNSPEQSFEVNYDYKLVADKLKKLIVAKKDNHGIYDSITKYNDAGFRIFHKDFLGIESEYDFDSQNNLLVKTQDGVQEFTSFDYKERILSKEQRANGKAKKYQIKYSNQFISQMSHNDRAYDFSRDDSSYLFEDINLSDANQNINMRRLFDGNGNIVYTSSSDQYNKTSQYKLFDAFGNKLEESYTHLNTNDNLSSAYDHIDYVFDRSKENFLKYTFDEFNRVTSISDFSRVPNFLVYKRDVCFVHDGVSSKEFHQANGGCNTINTDEVVNSYYDQGALKKLSTPTKTYLAELSLNDNKIIRLGEFRYSYDSLGRIKAVNNSNDLINFSYLNNQISSELGTVVLNQGKALFFNDVEYQYDAFNRLSGFKNADTHYQLEFNQYDEQSHLEINNEFKQSYSFDLLGGLKEVRTFYNNQEQILRVSKKKSVVEYNDDIKVTLNKSGGIYTVYYPKAKIALEQGLTSQKLLLSRTVNVLNAKVLNYELCQIDTCQNSIDLKFRKLPLSFEYNKSSLLVKKSLDNAELDNILNVSRTYNYDKDLRPEIAAREDVQRDLKLRLIDDSIEYKSGSHLVSKLKDNQGKEYEIKYLNAQKILSVGNDKYFSKDLHLINKHYVNYLYHGDHLLGANIYGPKFNGFYPLIADERGSLTHIFSTKGELIETRSYTDWGKMHSLKVREYDELLSLFKLNFAALIKPFKGDILISDSRVYFSKYGQWATLDSELLLNPKSFLSRKDLHQIDGLSYCANDPINYNDPRGTLIEPISLSLAIVGGSMLFSGAVAYLGGQTIMSIRPTQIGNKTFNYAKTPAQLNQSFFGKSGFMQKLGKPAVGAIPILGDSIDVLSFLSGRDLAQIYSTEDGFFPRLDRKEALASALFGAASLRIDAFKMTNSYQMIYEGHKGMLDGFMNTIDFAGDLNNSMQAIDGLRNN
jgi:hypothetical protein